MSFLKALVKIYPYGSLNLAYVAINLLLGKSVKMTINLNVFGFFMDHWITLFVLSKSN